ncbi:molybdopterin cofactor-binding domain-containing protein [Rhizobium sp. C4]|uniref:molybdopterin cofactor-binding domain-containing protein n=1 Tax=Rhizobium sp. C4 TaxID=1349800 RepID=UPI001E2917C8|nr:molybdopterin cofactor-binding domain-containing protein [Rhizobium sp. C4]MCD2172441.1 molybdopterin-dependent oxidoreductase [Rhizobium sp. C4]
MEVVSPASLSQALALHTECESRFCAGGTALQLDWAKGLAKPARLINLARISELKAVTESAEAILIGPLATLSELLRDPAISGHVPLLHDALSKVAGPSIRNRATLGGNIAGMTGCLLPALIALDARLEWLTLDGPTEMDIAQWLAMHPKDGILTRILLPLQGQNERWLFRKIGLRAAFTPSVINAAARLSTSAEGDILDARLTVGGGIVPPTRLRQAEALLNGSNLKAINWRALHDCLMETISAPTDAFRSADYRKRIAANAIVHGLGGDLPGRKTFPVQSALASMPAQEGEIRLARENATAVWHQRPDIDAKISGNLLYLTDSRRSDMLVGRILRAGVPHARILSIDTSAAEALPGVAAVVTHRDINGLNAFGIVVQDQPALCFDTVRYAGDAVAAVAAIDSETAERALALIKVDYQPLPIVTDPEEALRPDAPSIHAGGNLQRELHFARGDIAAGFAGAAHIVETTYVTPRQMHGFMETEGGHAYVDDEGTLHMLAGGQHGGRDRMQLSRILGMAEDKIRVVTSPTGGAFGGKDELTVQPALALLALKSRKPVRLHLSRAESVLAGQKRNPMSIRMKTAIDSEGRLVAQKVEVLAEAGAYASLGPGVLETALEHAAGPYVIDNVRTHGRLAYTNNGVCGAFRGFGANQMTYAVECQMDKLAAACGLTAAEIRRRNLRKPGMAGYLGQLVAPTERADEMLAAAVNSELWTRPLGLAADEEWIIGTGMALNYQGNGLGSVVPDPSGGRLSLSRPGMIEGGFGLDELGQGLMTLVKATVAAELGCARDDVAAVIGDTARAPESGSTTASRGTYVVWASTRLAAPDFAGQMRSAAGRVLGREPNMLALAPGGFIERGTNSGDILLTYKQLADQLDEEDLPSVTVTYEFPKNDYTASNARLIFAFGAALARVAISRVTGEVRVLDLHQHTAAGPVMDLAAYLGQIEGGAVQGLGFTLTEDSPMREGLYLSANLDTYMLPGIQDAPKHMQSFALESLAEGDIYGPRGVGELGIGAVTPAIANAVFAAIGHMPTVTPFPTETILAALEEGQ